MTLNPAETASAEVNKGGAFLATDLYLKSSNSNSRSFLSNSCCFRFFSANSFASSSSVKDGVGFIERFFFAAAFSASSPSSSSSFSVLFFSKSEGPRLFEFCVAPPFASFSNQSKSCVPGGFCVAPPAFSSSSSKSCSAKNAMSSSSSSMYVSSISFSSSMRASKSSSISSTRMVIFDFMWSPVLNFQTVCLFCRNFCSSLVLLLKPKIRPSSEKKKATTKALFFFPLFVVLFSLPKKKNNLKISITKVASLHRSFLENGSVLLDAV